MTIHAAARTTRSTRSNGSTGWVPFALVSIVLGFAAIRRGDVSRHRAWMTCAYALALGAGTQVFTQGIGKALFGTSELTTDLCLGAGWVINLAVAEYVIRRSTRRRAIIGRPTINSRSIRATAKVGSS